MAHFHKIEGKHSKPSGRSTMKAEAAQIQARVKVEMPLVRVEVGLVRLGEADVSGFIFTVPDMAAQQRIEAGLNPKSTDMLMARVRPWVGGRPCDLRIAPNS